MQKNCPPVLMLCFYFVIDLELKGTTDVNKQSPREILIKKNYSPSSQSNQFWKLFTSFSLGNLQYIICVGGNKYTRIVLVK